MNQRKIPLELVKRTLLKKPHALRKIRIRKYAQQPHIPLDHYCKRTPGMAIVASVGRTFDQIQIRITAFPKEGHWSEFERASRFTKPNGPSHDNPYGIGSIHLHGDLSSPYLHVEFIQAHFFIQKKGRPIGLPDKLATQYKGWRKQAITMALEVAKRERKIIVVPRFSADVKNPAQILKDIEDACIQKGLQKEATEHGTQFITRNRELRLFIPN
ncbi:MAG: hypothetical protein HY917_00245 [Candidatus Diapherotrites archaeon]|nr:hypothetical protein [Candidatus Diapherotrites archaeon]